MLCERKARTLLFGSVDCFYRPCAIVAVDYFNRLLAELFAKNRLKALLKRRLEDNELVRVHRALHDALAKAVCAVYEDDFIEARFGVESEHHPAARKVRAHHPLHAD